MPVTRLTLVIDVQGAEIDDHTITGLTDSLGEHVRSLEVDAPELRIKSWHFERTASPSKTIVVCHRDPDSSNEFHIFGRDDVEIIDIDYGRANLYDKDEFKEWADALLGTATRLLINAGCNGDGSEAVAACDALVHVAKAVRDAADNYGHTEDQ